ncbi:MAG: glutaredoxin family protein [Planctomycetaceae bacterium]|nr:glutaredoxin family protein [Planctomycetaceae bacterium]
MESANLETRRSNAPLGTAFLLLGFVLAGIVLTLRMDADWGRFGSLIARNAAVSWGLSLAFMLGGAWLIRHPSGNDGDWAPTIPGQRFRKAVLYTRANCPLCDEARRTLDDYRAYLPNIKLIDIDGEPPLRERYCDCVPVLELDGRVRFRGHVSDKLLRRLIEGTAPGMDERST